MFLRMILFALLWQCLLGRSCLAHTNLSLRSLPGKEHHPALAPAVEPASSHAHQLSHPLRQCLILTFPCISVGAERQQAGAPSGDFYLSAHAPAAESFDAQASAPAAREPTANILFAVGSTRAILSKDWLELAGVSSVVQSIAHNSETRVYQTSACLGACVLDQN